VLEYIEPMCIEAQLEAHIYDLYIPTHLGLEEYMELFSPSVISGGLTGTGIALLHFAVPLKGEGIHRHQELAGIDGGADWQLGFEDSGM